MRIAVDVMGGDMGPDVLVNGALEAAAAYPGGFDLLLVGREGRISPLLEGRMGGPTKVEVVHAAEVIEMSEAPATAFRRKKDASITVGMRLIRDGHADAMVSAGNTGAAVASALVTLGRLHGISRPAISTMLPNKKNGAVLLDVGANHECTPKNLLQFALMGSVFAKYQLGIDEPRVGLLNIGEERSKGNELVRGAYDLLEGSGMNFVGNVEGRDVFDGAADVVVCDGFVGNVILKFSESIYSFLTHMLRDAIRKRLFAKVGGLLMKSAFRSLRGQLDYAEYGGAPLLGVDGVVIISHGESDSRAIKNAVLAAAKSVKMEINQHIEGRLQETVVDIARAT